MARGGKGWGLGRMGGGIGSASHLSSWFSYNSASAGITGIGRFGKRMSGIAAEVNKDVGDVQQKGYGQVVSSLNRMLGTLGGTIGKQFDAAIRSHISAIDKRGGSKIAGAILEKELTGLKNDVSALIGKATGSQQVLIQKMSGMLSGIIEKSGRGFRGIGGRGREALRASYEFSDFKTADKAAATFTKSLNDIAKATKDSNLAITLTNVNDGFNRLIASAKTVDEKFNIIGDYANRIAGLGKSKSLSGEDAKKITEAAQAAQNTKDSARQSIIENAANRSGAIKADRWNQFAKNVGTLFKYGGHIKQGFDAANTLFQQVNRFTNQFARMQMGISRERGAYGRQIRGAGIGYGDMMSAIGAGRSAGMEDNAVINQMVSLQEDLAKARWGEGNMINAAGRWGISTFRSDGSVKDAHELMIDFSRKLNSLTDKSEKLQFLSHIGRRPEEMEYIANYEQHAKRMEWLKKNPYAMGTLERADMLDQSGMHAKIDAATKIELRRRELENQNAIDKGILPGLMQKMKPINWAFSDWTARQQGVRAAKSEVAIDNLSKELEFVRKDLRENKNALSKNTSNLVVSSKTLEGLSLDSGTAEADILNRGKKSGYHVLRQALHKQIGSGMSVAGVQRANSVTGGAVGGGAGLLAGAGVGAATGAMIGGIPGAIIGAIIGGISGAIFGVGAGSKVGIDAFGRFSGEQYLVDQLRGAKNNPKALQDILEMYHLNGLTAEMVRSKNFKKDKHARKMVSGAFASGFLHDVQMLTDNKVDPQSAMNFTSDKYYRASERAAKLGQGAISRKTMVGAGVRAATGNENLAIDSDAAYNYVKFGYDTTTEENEEAEAKEIRRLRALKENKSKSNDELKKIAQSNLKQEFQKSITREVYLAAEQKAREKGAHEYEMENQEEYSNLLKNVSVEEMTVANNLGGWNKAAKKYKEQLEAGGLTEEQQDQLEKRLYHAKRMVSFNQGKELYADIAAKKLEEETFGEKGKGFEYETDENQVKQFEEFRKQNGANMSASQLTAQFAISKGISRDAARNLLYASAKGDMSSLSEEDRKEAELGSKAQAAKTQAESEKEEAEKKKSYEERVRSASMEELTKAFGGDEGKAAALKHLLIESSSGGKLNENEEAGLQEMIGEAGAALEAGAAEEEENKEPEVSEVDKELDQLFAQQAAHNKDIEEGRIPTDEYVAPPGLQGDTEGMDEWNRATQKQMAEHIRIRDRNLRRNRRQAARMEAASRPRRPHDRRWAISGSKEGFGFGGKGFTGLGKSKEESVFGVLSGTQDKVSQASQAMASAGSRAEAAAASGVVAASGENAYKSGNKNITVTMGGQTIYQNFAEGAASNAEAFKNTMHRSGDEIANKTCAALVEVSKKVGTPGSI